MSRRYSPLAFWFEEAKIQLSRYLFNPIFIITDMIAFVLIVVGIIGLFIPIMPDLAFIYLGFVILGENHFLTKFFKEQLGRTREFWIVIFLRVLMYVLVIYALLVILNFLSVVRVSV